MHCGPHFLLHHQASHCEQAVSNSMLLLWGLMTSILRVIVLLLLALLGHGEARTEVRKAPDFGGGAVWLDKGERLPHHIPGYRGHVVLIDFWEYTCINCIRDFAVLKRWYGKYQAHGLVIIGVHRGEFDIGFKEENVRAAAKRFRLPWPIVADQTGSTWKAFHASGWPDRFLIDSHGDIVMEVLGERNNHELESRIRELLAASNSEVTKENLDTDEDAFKSECGVPTQETFVGQLYGRGAVDDLDSHKIGDVADFLPPHSPPDGAVMLTGRWRVERDSVASAGHSSSAEIRYHARSLYAVLSLEDTKQERVDLFLDGHPLPREEAGADVQFDSRGAYVEVSDARMFYLVRSPNFSAHLLALVVPGSGLRVHSFTYGNNCQLLDRP